MFHYFNQVHFISLLRHKNNNRTSFKIYCDFEMSHFLGAAKPSNTESKNSLNCLHLGFHLEFHFLVLTYLKNVRKDQVRTQFQDFQVVVVLPNWAGELEHNCSLNPPPQRKRGRNTIEKSSRTEIRTGRPIIIMGKKDSAEGE